MTTPIYRGATQPPPTAAKDLLQQISAYLSGSGTPAYAGAAQPAAATRGGLFGSETPAYAVPVTAPDAGTVDAEAGSVAPCTEPADALACPLDPEALAAGHIAIVIPRGG
jgi:hypothetical protein